MEKVPAAGEAVPEAERQSPAVVANVVIGLLRTATDEYEAAIVDGKFANVVEYQDSLGFVRTARRLIEERAEEIRSADADAYDAVVQQIAELEKVWPAVQPPDAPLSRSEEHTSELQSLMRISYAVFCLKKKHNHRTIQSDIEKI